MKLNYNELAFYQEQWKESKNIPTKKSQDLVQLADIFIRKVKANDGETNGVVLLFPEDCPNIEVFMEFASVMSAYVTVRRESGLQMDGWQLNRKVEV